MDKNILICGVGGQGILLASDILARVALESGFDAKKSEVHGMAQRGGAVVSTVKIGTKIYSPLITENEADFILAFEMLEALRRMSFLKNGGTYIVNDYKLPPLSVSTGVDKYPENIPAILKGYAKEVIIVDGIGLAKKAGNPKTVNTILLGALAKKLDFTVDCWVKVLKEHLPPKILDVNLQAFKLGYETA